MKAVKALIVFLGVILAALAVVPLLIPLPPLEGVRPLEEITYPDSRFIEINGLDVHYQRFGDGDPAIILLHGFGASTFSWREVTAPLAQYGTVIAYDRPAFGLTERPMPEEFGSQNPYTSASNLDILRALLDANDIQKAILIGNSAGGTVATAFALEYPERVSGLVLVDAAIYQTGGRFPEWVKPILQTPQARRLGQLGIRSIAGPSGDDFLKSAWHDPSRITPQIVEGYRRPLQVAHWDRALWEFTLAASPEDLAQRLGEISVPTLVVTGDDDRIVPTDLSIRLSQEIPSARLAVFSACGHVPQEECPDQFLQVAGEFIQMIAKGE